MNTETLAGSNANGTKEYGPTVDVGWCRVVANCDIDLVRGCGPARAVIDRRMRTSFAKIILLVTVAIEGLICDYATPGAWHGSNVALQLSDDEGVC